MNFFFDSKQNNINQRKNPQQGFLKMFFVLKKTKKKIWLYSKFQHPRGTLMRRERNNLRNHYEQFHGWSKIKKKKKRKSKT